MAVDFPSNPRSGSIGWTCASNIALVKYWGKAPGQIPKNPSLSMTLKEARTSTTLSYSYEPGLSKSELLFRFEGKEAPSFQDRIASYLESIESLLPFLSSSRLEISSTTISLTPLPVLLTTRLEAPEQVPYGLFQAHHQMLYMK